MSPEELPLGVSVELLDFRTQPEELRVRRKEGREVLPEHGLSGRRIERTMQPL